MRKFVVIAALAGSLSACAVYHATPLPTAPVLASQAPAPKMNMASVVKYALANSPDLIAARQRANVVLAQAYEGGLLPDPQISASADHPTVHGAGLVTGYALGLAQDLQALLTEPSRAEASRARQTQAKLGLLWTEWQMAQNAQTLVAQKYYADGKLEDLQQTAKILQQQALASSNALTQHNTTINMAGADLSASLDISSQRDAAARAAINDDSDLKALLGLAPEAVLTLSDPGNPRPISRKDVDTGLKDVVRARPDLLALQAGYHAQDEAVRTAILQQFPAINIGFNRASDTSNIQSNGLGVTINIPIFGSTQANIHTARTTRAQLRAEYQARLDQTTADSWRIWRRLHLLRRQVQDLAISVPQLRKMAATGRRAYVAGNLAPATYVLLETSLSARETELFDLRAILWQDTIALRTLLAMTPLIPEHPHAN